MKILIISHYFPPHIGGIEFVAQNQAKHLARHGHSISVLTSAIGAPKGKQEHPDSYTIYRVSAINSLEKAGIPFPIFYPKLLILTFKLVKEADVVHAHDAFYFSSFIAAFWAWVLRKPYILNQHVAIVPHSKKIVNFMQAVVYSTSGKFIFWESSRIIILNSHVKDFLIHHRINPNKIILIPNGVDTTVYRPAKCNEKLNLRKKYKLPQNKHLALFVGRFVHKKGFETLLKAGDDAYKIVLVGGDAPKKYIYDKHFIFLGRLTPTDTAEVYRACDLFVLPSQGEGFPLSIQEAMASGLPIITSDDKGYDIYEFNRDLFDLISPEPSIIKKRLIELLSDAKELKARSDYSINYIKQHFDWDKIITRLLLTYKDANV